MTEFAKYFLYLARPFLNPEKTYLFLQIILYEEHLVHLDLQPTSLEGSRSVYCMLITACL